METQICVRNNNNSNSSSGGIKLPIGFRFHPTDEELIVHYLSRKVYSLPLPASFIPELDVFQTNPWDLPGELREKRYFFSRRKEDEKKLRRVATGCGYWKPSGQDKQINAVGSNQTIGIKKCLVFYQGKRLHGTRTKWVMHQYSLLHSIPDLCRRQNFIMQVGDWILCRIYQKKTQPKKNTQKTQESSGKSRIRNMDPKIEKEVAGSDHPQASLTCSSEITHQIPHAEIEQEVSSDYRCSNLMKH